MECTHTQTHIKVLRLTVRRCVYSADGATAVPFFFDLWLRT